MRMLAFNKNDLDDLKGTNYWTLNEFNLCQSSI